MGETFVLSLEVDDNGSIKVQNFKKNVEDAGDSADKTGKQGSAGFHLFGLAAAKAGEEIGIPFRASHMLGTRVAEMVKTEFPAFGMSLGGVGLAAIAATVIISKLTESHKKHEEELKQEIETLSKMTDELYKNTYATADLNKAKDAQAESARITLQTKLTDQYQLQYEKLQKLNKEASAGGSAWSEIWAGLTHTSTEGYDRAMDALKVKTQNTARDAATALETLYQEILKISNPPEKKQYDTLQYQIEREREYQSVLKERGVTLTQQHAVEMTLFDLETKNLEYKLKAEGREPEQVKAIIGLRNEERAALESSFDVKNRDNDWIARRIALQKEEHDTAKANVDRWNAGIAALRTRGEAVQKYNETLRGHYDNLLLAGLGWDQLAAKTHGASMIITDSEAMITRATQARGNISIAMNKAMETELMKLVETHRLSLSAIGQALMQAAKQELVALAAQASIKALYYTAAGLVATATGDEGAAALFYAAAGDYAAIAGATLAGAAAINAVSGSGAGAGSIGSSPGNPVYTSGGSGSGNGYQIYYEQDPNNPHSNGTGWRPGEGSGQHVTVEVVVNDPAFSAKVVNISSKNYKDQGVLYDAVNN